MHVTRRSRVASGKDSQAAWEGARLPNSRFCHAARSLTLRATAALSCEDPTVCYRAFGLVYCSGGGPGFTACGAGCKGFKALGCAGCLDRGAASYSMGGCEIARLARAARGWGPGGAV